MAAVPFITVGRKLNLTLVSADNLRDVRKWGRMKVYAEVSINEAPETVKKIKADRRGETNPRWIMAAADYTISEAALRQPGVNVVVKLMCKRKMGDKFVGKVKIPITTLFEMGVGQSENVVMGYNVEGCPNGKLNISCSFSAPTQVTILAGDSNRAAVTKRAALISSLNTTNIFGQFGFLIVNIGMLVFTGKTLG